MECRAIVWKHKIKQNNKINNKIIKIKKFFIGSVELNLKWMKQGF